MQIYDLHSHSNVSDGLLSPQELVTHAKQAGVDILALTDHDTTAGLSQAEKRASDLTLTLIPGVEISTTWQNRTVHIVGLGVNANNATLQNGLHTLQATRRERALAIAHRLNKAGISGIMSWTTAQLETVDLTRTHFARYLVAQGKAKTVAEVFKNYLRLGKPGYVSTAWAGLEETVTWIRAAGGCAVIAHPGRYKLTGTKMRRLIDMFNDVGGAGIEVSYGGCDRDTTQYNINLCERFSLMASVGSDFHDPNIPWTRLGRSPRLPEHLTPIWQHENLVAFNNATQNHTQAIV